MKTIFLILTFFCATLHASALRYVRWDGTTDYDTLLTASAGNLHIDVSGNLSVTPDGTFLPLAGGTMSGTITGGTNAQAVFSASAPVFQGSNNTMPNQTLTGSSSVLTQGLADTRYSQPLINGAESVIWNVSSPSGYTSQAVVWTLDGRVLCPNRTTTLLTGILVNGNPYGPLTNSAKIEVYAQDINASYNSWHFWGRGNGFSQMFPQYGNTTITEASALTPIFNNNADLNVVLTGVATSSGTDGIVLTGSQSGMHLTCTVRPSYGSDGLWIAGATAAYTNTLSVSGTQWFIDGEKILVNGTNSGFTYNTPANSVSVIPASGSKEFGLFWVPDKDHRARFFGTSSSGYMSTTGTCAVRFHAESF